MVRIIPPGQVEDDAAATLIPRNAANRASSGRRYQRHDAEAKGNEVS
jgi:hypothetical protein